MYKHTTYLGDAVYVSLGEDNQMLLTTGSHRREEASNAIWLNADVVKALREWLAAHAQEVAL